MSDRADSLELLAQLVEIPSHASQRAGIVQVAELVGTAVSALGFEPQEPARPSRSAPAWAETLLCPEVRWEDLLDPWVWRRPGSGPGTLLLLGDLDAALALEASDCHLSVQAGRALGPGVADMKAGLVTMILALRRAIGASQGIPSITIVLSGDEQAGSLRSAPTIRSQAAAATWCLCFECGRDGGKLMRSRGHIGVGRLTASGVAAHAGSARATGVNAAVELARAIVAIDAEGVSTADATVTPTIISGGTRRSVVPDRAEAVLDVRARDEVGWNALEGRIRTAIAAEPRITVELFNHRPGLPATDRTSGLLHLMTELGAGMGQRIEAADSLAAGSSAFVDSSAVAVLDGVGPAGGGLMTAGEYVEVDSIAARAELVAATIVSLGV